MHKSDPLIARFSGHGFLAKTLSLLLAFIALTGTVLGASNTQVSPIGYSSQGRYFAYEEFGQDIQTGTGFSNIHIVDLIQISQVVGTPITYQASLNEQSLADIRRRSLADAQLFLNSVNVTTPAQTIVMIGDGQLDTERNRLEFGIPVLTDAELSSRSASSRYLLRLKTFETPSTLQCSDFMQTPPLGFSLEVANYGSGVEVYKDTVLARSRECPFNYELYSVTIPFGAPGVTDSVGLISVDTHGEGGVKRHFLAIPLAFSIAGKN